MKSIIDGDKTAKEIEIKNVSGTILKHIVDYLDHHQGKTPEDIVKPIRSNEMEKNVEDPFDATFINKLEDKESLKVIFNVILGANYMGLRSLLHLGCAKIATKIKGKSPEEIKKILGDAGDVDERRRLLEAMTNFSK